MKRIIFSIIFVLILLSLALVNFNNEVDEIPKDRIKEDQIFVYPDRVLINLDNAKISYYADTNSMLPFIDEGANGIEILVDKEDIEVGDILNFEVDEKVISHRVIEIGNDKEGWFAITQGDNNFLEDGKVREDQIISVLVGVLY